MGAELLLPPGSWRLVARGIGGRGVRVPPSLKPSVMRSRGICSMAGALLEPIVAGVSPTLSPLHAGGTLPRKSSGPASDCCCSDSSGVSCSSRHLLKPSYLSME